MNCVLIEPVAGGLLVIVPQRLRAVLTKELVEMGFENHGEYLLWRVDTVPEVAEAIRLRDEVEVVEGKSPNYWRLWGIALRKAVLSSLAKELQVREMLSKHSVDVCDEGTT